MHADVSRDMQMSTLRGARTYIQEKPWIQLPLPWQVGALKESLRNDRESDGWKDRRIHARTHAYTHAHTHAHWQKRDGMGNEPWASTTITAVWRHGLKCMRRLAVVPYEQRPWAVVPHHNIARYRWHTLAVSSLPTGACVAPSSTTRSKFLQ